MRLFSATISYKVIHLIKELVFKLIHVRNRPLYMPYLRKKLGNNVKLVLHEHNQNIVDMLSKSKAVEVLDLIDAYVAVSRFTFDYEITKRYPQYAGKARVILNGVNLEKFRPWWEQTDKVRSLRQIYGVKGSTNVLFTGAIRERKGIRELVEAFKLVVKDHPEAKPLIAGGDKDNLEAADAFAKRVKRSADEIHDNVVWLGFIPASNIQDAYLLGDIFVGPSLWEEAFGLVFAEASASGLPVIGSRRGGIPEIIDDGKTGLLVEPENISEMAEKIGGLIHDPVKCDIFGRAARKKMEDNFSWERVANEIEALYDSLLK